MTKAPDPRDTYLAIATRLFASAGFHGVSLAAIAEEAGVSKQAVLHFFSTKEKLYARVLAALCDRLCAEIEETREVDPKTHLEAYFAQISVNMVRDPRDVRLVMRALLDSDPKAQTWPLKPYLDRLLALVQSLPRGAAMGREEALAEAYRFIGSVQYVALSLPTIEGIYGAEAREALAASARASAKEAVARLL